MPPGWAWATDPTNSSRSIDTVGLAGIFESLMLLGFASAWPMSILKSWRARTTAGTSLAFLITIECAYVCGMVSKVVAGDITYVFAFYVLDFSLVATALAVYARNLRLDRAGRWRNHPRLTHVPNYGLRAFNSGPVFS